MAPSIQVAFQGGGARFVEMLPIAHALADAHRDGYVRITRVAGCSAGSICAALIAYRANFKDAKDFIIRDGPLRAREMRRFSTNFGKKFCGISIDRIRLGRALMQARGGTPLLKTKVLVDFLSDLFAEATKNDPTGKAANGPKAINSETNIQALNQIPGGIRLAITGADLRRGQGETFEEGNLIDRVASSCAIPFAFRTYSDVVTSPYVDGGVCENLPVERLFMDEDSDGPVFAVSIVEDNPPLATPANVKDYLLQLLSASMNHNVERAKRLVGNSNVIAAETKLTTFDFEGAIAKLANPSFYDSAYRRTYARMVHFFQLHSNVQSVEPFNLSGRVSASKVMRSLFRVFESSFATLEWTYIKGTFLVRADGLQKTGDGPKLADRCSQIAKIKANDNNLVCFMSSATVDVEGSIQPTTWTCYNDTQKRDLRIQAIPVQRVVQGPRSTTPVLLFFESPIQSIVKDDVLTITSHYMKENAMDGLATNGSDFIATLNPHRIPVETADLVLAYPKTFGSITVAPDITGIVTLPIQQNELQQQYGSVVSSDYRFSGLRTENLLPGSDFRAIFTKVP